MGDRPNSEDCAIDATTRRRLLRYSGVVAGAGLSAGCSGSDGGDGGGDGGDGGDGGSDGSDGGDGGGDGGGGDGGDGGDGDGEMTETETEMSGGTPMDSTFGLAHWYSASPADVQYNPDANPGAPVSFEKLAQVTSHPDAESFYYPVLAEEWNYDSEGDMFTIALRDTTWWNGDPVTAEDLITSYRITMVTDTTLRDAVDSFNAVDEKTLEVSLTGKFNPGVLTDQMVNFAVDRPRRLYEDTGRRVVEASSSDEYESISADLVERTIEEPVGNTVWKHDSYGSQAISCVVNEGHFVADAWQGIEEVKIFNATSENKRWERFLGDQADSMAATVPEASRDALPDHALEVYNPAFVHSGFILNHNRGPLADRRARKALAYVLDREQIAGNMSQSFPANSDIVGFSHSYDQFLGADFVENQIEHYDADTEKAAQLLRDAGLEKSGGTWMWEGEPWQPSIYSHGFADFVTMGRTGSSVLQEFGIQAEYSQIEFSALATRMTEVDFDMAIFFSGRGVWPQVPFSNDLTGATWGMDNYAGSPANDKTLEVPPVGELGGSMETYDAAGKTTELAQATGEDELQELRRELAWVYNQTLPAIQIAPRNIGHTLSTDDWNVAEDDVRLGFLNPAVWVPSQGGMTPKYQ